MLADPRHPVSSSPPQPKDDLISFKSLVEDSSKLARCSTTCHGLLLAKSLFLSGQAESTNATNESILKVALDHGKASGMIKSHDRVVVCQKVGDASVVKIIELED